MFIATANVAETIPGPLLDRMEVIRFDGYTVQEKVAIARGLPVAAPASSATASTTDEVERRRRRPRSRRQRVHARGRRAQADRKLGTALRKTATRIASGEAEAPVVVDVDAVRDALGKQRFFQESASRTAVPGVSTGLAVTGTGGDVLFVEATACRASPTWSSRASWAT